MFDNQRAADVDASNGSKSLESGSNPTTHASQKTSENYTALPSPLNVASSEFLSAIHGGGANVVHIRVLPAKLKNQPKPTPEALARFSKAKVPYFAWLQSIVEPYGVNSRPFKEAIACQFFADPKNNLVKRLHRTNAGSDARGVYFVVNGGGHGKNDITHYRAFVIEFDDRPLEEQWAKVMTWPIQPHIVVKTRSSLHFYWLADTETTGERWDTTQRTLIVFAGSDPTIKDRSRVMRVPGFDHTTFDFATGEVSRIPVAVLKFDTDRRVSADEMLAMMSARGAPEVSVAKFNAWLRERKASSKERTQGKREKRYTGAARMFAEGEVPSDLKAVFNTICARLDMAGGASDGQEIRAICPCCGDPNPSFTATLAADKILVNCFALCSFDELCASLGVEAKNLFAAHWRKNGTRLDVADDGAEPPPNANAPQQDGDGKLFKLADGRLIRAGFHNLDGALTWVKDDGAIVKLANFAAQIIGDVAHDDGAEVTRHFEVEAKLIGECISKTGIVPAADFEPMRWLPSLLGARAFAWPGQKERASVAIRFLSRDIKERRVVAHTGWRQDGDGWRYYHAGGAIGAEGLIDAEVDLPNALAPFNLPKPPTAERLREMVRAVAFDLPRVAPDAITLPLIGAAFVSVLTAPDFSLFLFGYTGSGKSELAALLQSFFGAGFHAKNLPAAWSSSANSLEAIAHTAADAVLVVDDFCPAGASADQARLHAAADRVLRAQGNHSGRGRCRADGTVKPAKPPRGLIVATGEDVPRGQSLRARLATIQIEKDSVNWAELTKCQAAARAGVYADAMSAFLQWLAREKRIEKLRATMSDEIGKLRTAWNERAGDAHKRNATTLAQIQHAWSIWLQFAEKSGALDSDECVGLRESVEIALDSLGNAQNAYQAGENPALRFVELIQAALTSGKAHLAAMDNGKPDDCESWGWRADGPENEFRPMGDRIGWIDGDNVYLNPDAAYTCAQKITANGEGLIVSSQTLWKRLKEAGLLASVDAARETQKVRRKIGEKTQTVIHLMCEIFSG